ncbi:hypothetical protein GCK72_025135 [Caenorhabditis remanei]|uniref:Uncharacterized protein n=1 Tax=Caenorhabditis remanei TaxID=31234 RepID=A0A6A5G155_CAERE|nr:hypothetical protein GCK72_025135 [Caenorhabditis remanei]KAF1748668.1 hypothetical protein GCK72_025135 [Caenorhabditis remanei]
MNTQQNQDLNYQFNYQEIEKENICRFAEVLRTPVNPIYEKSNLLLYLSGQLDGEKLGMMMYHNKVHHQCTTVDQCSQLVLLLEARKTCNQLYDKAACITDVLNVVEKLEAVDKRLGITAQPLCINRWEDLHQLETQNEVFLTPNGIQTASRQMEKFKAPTGVLTRTLLKRKSNNN